MNADDFTLQPSTPPDPAMFDVDPVTLDWPLPPVKAWAPRPFDLDAMCEEARQRLAVQLDEAVLKAHLARVVHFEIVRPAMTSMEQVVRGIFASGGGALPFGVLPL